MDQTPNIVYTSKILRKKKTQLAIFDVDWTLIKPKEARRFPKDASDWEWLRASVPKVVQKYDRKGYRIVFLTDQTKPWKVDMIKEVAKQLEVPVVALIAMNKTYHKPNPAFFQSHFGDDFDRKGSFYVGDAAGREGDWSPRDKEFAKQMGLRFYTPEELFPLEKKTLTDTEERKLVSMEKEVVVMVGYPGSGKSTLVKKFLEPRGYIRIDGDLLKTPSKMVQVARSYIGTHSVVFDATNGTKEKREHFLQFAKEHGVPVRCIWVKTSLEDSMEQNRQRAQEGGPKVPEVAFYVYRKHFESPTQQECTTLVEIGG